MSKSEPVSISGGC